MQKVVVYTVGALLYLYGDLSTSAIMVCLMVMTRALGPADSVVSNWRRYSNFLGALDRMDDLLRQAADRPERTRFPSLHGPLSVSRLFAAAPGSDRFVLTDISFRLRPGRTLGIVGPSGAGKSCLAKVLVGVWPAARGSVVIGDHDIAHWREDDLGRRIGYMSQDIELLPGTLSENIARFSGAAEADTSALLAAAELADIHELVRSLPHGYNTRVGPGGHVLSGGQRARIALARALYGAPAYIVLDEPNSSLDALGERALVATLQKLKAAEATVLLITHKMQILNVCDDVLVLNAGAVQAFGAREQVLGQIHGLRSSPALTLIEGAMEGRRS
jgi:ABC-type protease/lipase transport system fused ATPase/permease subunit